MPGTGKLYIWELHILDLFCWESLQPTFQKAQQMAPVKEPELQQSQPWGVSDSSDRFETSCWVLLYLSGSFTCFSQTSRSYEKNKNTSTFNNIFCMIHVIQSLLFISPSFISAMLWHSSSKCFKVSPSNVASAMWVASKKTTSLQSWTVRKKRKPNGVEFHDGIFLRVKPKIWRSTIAGHSSLAVVIRLSDYPTTFNMTPDTSGVTCGWLVLSSPTVSIPCLTNSESPWGPSK